MTETVQAVSGSHAHGATLGGTSRIRLLLALLLLFVVVSRVLTTEEYLAGIDSGNYMLGMHLWPSAARVACMPAIFWAWETP